MVGCSVYQNISGKMDKSVFDADLDSLIENDVIEIGRLAAVASDNLKTSMDTERTNNYVSFTTLKRMVIPKRYAKNSTFRVKFDLKSGHDAVTAHGQIWKNGGALGTDQSVLGQVYAEKSEDLVFDGGDLFELKTKVSSDNVYVRNLRVYCDTGGDAIVDGDLRWD